MSATEAVLVALMAGFVGFMVAAGQAASAGVPWW